MTSRAVSLSVNGGPIEVDYFVQGFLDHVTSGMMEMLEGAGPIKTLDLSLDGDKLKVIHNGKTIPTNPFVTRIITNTVRGMASSLKGVSEIKQLNLTIKK